MASNSLAASTSVLFGKAKLDDVTVILEKLHADLTEPNLLPDERTSLLEKLKVYGRDIKDADPIFTKHGIEVLSRHAFNSSSSNTSREALRCLANALLLQQTTRQAFVDLGFADKAAERLKSDNRDDEFLIGRILFLLTYNTNLNFNDLVEKNSLLETINQKVASHAKRYPKSGRRASQTSPMDEMAMSETLKLMFNVTHYYPGLSKDFSKSIPHIFKILFRIKVLHPPLKPPVCYIINALINLDLEGKNAQSNLGVNPVFPKFDQKCNAEHLVNVLDAAVADYPESELDQVAAPLVVLIRKVYELAPESVQNYMQQLLLPTEQERSQPLGKSDTLASKLLRLSTSAMAPNLRESISSMFFELSGKDASKFVKNVGYGFASGFLLKNNIQVPENATEAWSTNGDETNGAEINPITGQRRDAEPVDLGPPMSDEEKEREAERLFVLFERLKATGVINVKNPVEQALQEGRFEELD